jgi:hypothetical protein
VDMFRHGFLPFEIFAEGGIAWNHLSIRKLLGNRDMQQIVFFIPLVNVNALRDPFT